MRKRGNGQLELAFLRKVKERVRVCVCLANCFIGGLRSPNPIKINTLKEGLYIFYFILDGRASI